MNFLKGTWRWITRQDEIDSLQANLDSARLAVVDLQRIVYNATKTQQDLAAKVVNLEDNNSALSKLLADSQGTINGLQQSLAQAGGDVDAVCPDFLDLTKSVYKPAIAIPDSSEAVQVFDATAIYVPFDADKKDVSSVRKMDKASKLKKVWSNIINGRSYAYDGRDNWQTPYETRFRQKGDCEDGTVWFVSQCRAAGLKPTDVFNAVGPTGFGYHSFPIVFLEQNDVQVFGLTSSPGWYVFETTVGSVPNAPVPLVGSVYWIDGGLANWKFAGQIKDASLGAFNGRKTGAFVPLEERIIDNSDDKKKQIEEYWKKR